MRLPSPLLKVSLRTTFPKKVSLRTNLSLENPTVPVHQNSRPSGTMLEAVLPVIIPVKAPARRKTGASRSNRLIAAPTRSTAL